MIRKAQSEATQVDASAPVCDAQKLMHNLPRVRPCVRQSDAITQFVQFDSLILLHAHYLTPYT